MAIAVNDIDSKLSLSAAEYTRFCDFFYQQTGITFEPSRQGFVEKRLGQRMGELGLTSFSDYMSRVRWGRGNAEIQELINLLTINETYFFREQQQFEALVKHVLPEITRRRSRLDTINIWSCPCSTGEEPYSIALSLLEYWPDVDEFEVAIHGSDIDTSVIERARVGRFSSRSVSKLPPHVLSSYFTHHPADNEYEISKDLRDSINFFKHNVLKQDFRSKEDLCDVIFCRNMLIYFDETSRRIAVENFHNAMREDGVLFLGHSESMSRISSLFTPVKYGDAIGYRKKT